jgi:plasmid stability protein
MADLLIQDIDAEILEKLRKAAADNGRTLEEEVRHALERAAVRNMAETRRLSDYWQQYFSGRTFSDSTDLIREDRDR